MAPIKTKKITVLQFSSLLFLFLVGTSLIFINELVIAGRDAWITGILSAAAGLLVVLYLVSMSRFTASRGFGEWLDLVFGEIGGRTAAAVYLLFLLYQSSLVLQNTSHFVTSVIFLGADRSIFAACMMVLVVYLTCQDIEVLGRIAPALFAVFILLTFSMIPLQVKEYNFENVLPIMADGFTPVFYAVWTSISFPYAEATAMAPLVPFVKGLYEHRKQVLVFFGLAAVILIIGRLFPVLVFGDGLSRKLVFPILSMVRMIRIGTFLERVEAFLLSIWIVTSFIKVTILFYSSAVLLEHVFRPGKRNFLLVPLAIMIVALERVSYQNMLEAGEFASYIWPVFSVPFQVLLPITLYITAAIYYRKKIHPVQKRKVNQDESNQ